MSNWNKEENYECMVEHLEDVKEVEKEYEELLNDLVKCNITREEFVYEVKKLLDNASELILDSLAYDINNGNIGVGIVDEWNSQVEDKMHKLVKCNHCDYVYSMYNSDVHSVDTERCAKCYDTRN